jgi:hypothetical protein
MTAPPTARGRRRPAARRPHVHAERNPAAVRRRWRRGHPRGSSAQKQISGHRRNPSSALIQYTSSFLGPHWGITTQHSRFVLAARIVERRRQPRRDHEPLPHLGPARLARPVPAAQSDGRPVVGRRRPGPAGLARRLQRGVEGAWPRPVLSFRRSPLIMFYSCFSTQTVMRGV